MSKSLYEIIGVSPNADASAIEEKCLELGKQYHPDSNPNNLNAKLKFKEIEEAYEILGDPAKRALYDKDLSDTTILPTSKKTEQAIKQAQTTP